MADGDQQMGAWEDINPAARREAPAPSYSAYLKPATNVQFHDELIACLALVAPVGMNEEAKREWLSVAWATLKHLPSDLLAFGCKRARETCDHPSKIVSTIVQATEQSMRGRQESPRYTALPSPSKRPVMDRRGEPMSEADTAKLNECLENLGATARYRPDGSRYIVDKGTT